MPNSNFYANMAPPVVSLRTVAGLTDFVDFVRLDVSRTLDAEQRSALGQFFTPALVARLMASLSLRRDGRIRLVDPGAGVGVLAAAWIAHACSSDNPPDHVEVSAFELDPKLQESLRSVLKHCVEHAHERGVTVEYEVRQEDFIETAVKSLNGGLFGARWPAFDVAILNPPYRKFRTDSPERRRLRDVGIETSNLYTAFVALTLRSLEEGGEMIAITPRSFCNGPYFTPFRRDLLRLGSLTHVHVFDSRSSAFAEDAVLQENVVFRMERARPQAETVHIEWSSSGEAEHTERRSIPFTQVVRPGDSDAFIHITPNEWDTRIAEIVRGLHGNLATLGLQASTGRVVDFRATDHLRANPGSATVPLIYPMHFAEGRIRWPKLGAKKPNAIEHVTATESLLNPTGTYVLVKRFSAKEERRRVVAAIFTPQAAPGEFVAFENHLNYFHAHGRGLSRKLAVGLAAYLNSTVLDSYFRQFNGHTQVNATDLRKLPYPTAEQLERIAERAGQTTDQSQLDEIVEDELIGMPPDAKNSKKVQRRITEACEILKALGLPKEQTNERAGLTLLALLDLEPAKPWSASTAPLMGVTPIMEFAAENYGKQWKPNTRETVRRFTLHQFQDAGLVVANPDKPDRPVNSPSYCYQVPDPVLDLLRSFGSKEWDSRLRDYLASAGTLAAKYASERKMERIPLRVREGVEIALSPGGQNELIEKIWKDFCPVFTPGGTLLYIGDADDKWGYFDEAALRELGVTVVEHGKMPDVVVHFRDKNWLVVIEAVTSHGPVNPKRRAELQQLFKGSTAPLVYVTAFSDRQTLNRFLADIAWETEVWVADNPTHMIHFNGSRFLGPYE